MFTGIVEGTGVVTKVAPGAGGLRIGIETMLAESLAVGASLAVNGVCLTAVALDGRLMWADIGPETARVTTLGTLSAGTHVNLERPMPADGRFDGHLVLGHVDGIGTVSGVRAEAGSHWLTVAFPPSLAPLLIRKGSVAVDGISLTVAALGTETFDVQAIPHTWAHTTLRDRRPGDTVNLECDMIGKYVLRALEAREP